MSVPGENDSIQKARRELYERSIEDGAEPITESSQSVSESNKVDTDTVDPWAGVPISDQKGLAASPMNKLSMLKRFMKFSLLTKLLFGFGTVAVMVALMAVAALLIFNNGASPELVSLKLEPPAAVVAGAEETVSVNIKNQNEVAMTNVLLRSWVLVEDQVVPGEGAEVNIGEVAPRSTRTISLPQRFVGPQGSSQDITVELEYGLDGSSTRYSTSTTANITLSSAPVAVAIAVPEAVIPGEQVTLVFTLTSQSPQTIPSLLVTPLLPFSFEATTSNPDREDDNSWEISLDPEESITLSVNGQFDYSANSSETVTVVAELNNSQDVNDTDLIEIARAVKGVRISQPPARLELNTVPSIALTDLSAYDGEIKTLFTNTSGAAITNVEVTLKVAGALAPYISLKQSSANFSPARGELVWNRATYSPFGVVRDGETIEIEADFTLSVPPALQSSFTERPQIEFLVSATAEDVATFASGSVVARDQGVVQVASTPQIKVNLSPNRITTEETTSVTTTVDLTGYRNDFKNVTLSFSLPTYAEWIEGNTGSGEVSYNTLTRSVLWELGNVSAEATPQLINNLRVRPGPQQKGQQIVILRQMRLTGEDVVTGEKIDLSFRDVAISVR